MAFIMLFIRQNSKTWQSSCSSLNILTIWYDVDRNLLEIRKVRKQIKLLDKDKDFTSISYVTTKMRKQANQTSLVFLSCNIRLSVK